MVRTRYWQLHEARKALFKNPKILRMYDNSKMKQTHFKSLSHINCKQHYNFQHENPKLRIFIGGNKKVYFASLYFFLFLSYTNSVHRCEH